MKFIFFVALYHVGVPLGRHAVKERGNLFLFMRQSPEIYAHMIPQDRAIINISRDKTAFGSSNPER